MGEPEVFPYDDPAFVADPFPFYKRLRREGPVRRVATVRGIEGWLVTRYEDGLAALSDPRFSSDLRDATDGRLLDLLPSAERESFLRSMIRVGPPDHTRLRRLVSKAFTARRVAALRPRVQEITDDLIDAVAPAGRADLVADIALPLPVTVICELLGVPVTDRARFQEWTDDILGQEQHYDRDVVDRAWRRMWGYLEGLIADKRGHSGDDLISALITARDDEGSLEEDELVAMAFLLLVAGYITTVNLIAGGTATLLAHPQQLKLVRDDPGLLPGAVEELLRYDGPVNPGVIRFPTEDVEIGGVRIPRGDTVMIATAIADRDPEHFADPDRLDVTRTENTHLAFGHGAHYCLGAPLARLEGEIAIGTILRRLPDLTLAVPFDELRWHVASLRGPKAVPVTFTPV
ncbi:cytochrome P450 family protein [Actinoallomurus iriomotensis]|uniref:Cytochrome P450 hydroxylase n=1 Tax=Actinoallomurus iriomotensis TaxID=478107 RepID=A0A9W6RW71_9ACTN|nr:cytochrome P450 [Actinoallomurus iriomotensis]GLY82818.1 cytochrome P450 hydroxylase [Actinoallomurus iriomotensis]